MSQIDAGREKGNPYLRIQPPVEDTELQGRINDSVAEDFPFVLLDWDNQIDGKVFVVVPDEFKPKTEAQFGRFLMDVLQDANNVIVVDDLLKSL